MPGYVYKGNKHDVEEMFEVEPEPVEKKTRLKPGEIPPCGTLKGDARHRRLKEKCDECNEVRKAHRRKNHPRVRFPAECGTPSGYNAHRRKGEPICHDCRVASAEDAANRRGTEPHRRRPRFER